MVSRLVRCVGVAAVLACGGFWGTALPANPDIPAACGAEAGACDASGLVGDVKAPFPGEYDLQLSGTWVYDDSMTPTPFHASVDSGKSKITLVVGEKMSQGEGVNGLMSATGTLVHNWTQTPTHEGGLVSGTMTFHSFQPDPDEDSWLGSEPGELRVVDTEDQHNCYANGHCDDVPNWTGGSVTFSVQSATCTTMDGFARDMAAKLYTEKHPDQIVGARFRAQMTAETKAKYDEALQPIRDRAAAIAQEPRGQMLDDFIALFNQIKASSDPGKQCELNEVMTQYFSADKVVADEIFWELKHVSKAATVKDEQGNVDLSILDANRYMITRLAAEYLTLQKARALFGCGHTEDPSLIRPLVWLIKQLADAGDIDDALKTAEQAQLAGADESSYSQNIVDAASREADRTYENLVDQWSQASANDQYALAEAALSAERESALLGNDKNYQALTFLGQHGQIPGF